MKKLFLIVIRFYQKYITPYTPAHCRFYPTCSTYAYEAITRFGALEGGFLAIRRILRCHPFNKGGYDPVPQKPEPPQNSEGESGSGVE